MVSIIPPERSAFDVIGNAIGRNLENTLPQAAYRAGERQMGLNAIDEMQAALGEAGNDPSKIMGALARAITLNPQLARAGLEKIALRKAQAPSAISSPESPGIIATADDVVPNVPLSRNTESAPSNAGSYLRQQQELNPDLPEPEFTPDIFGGDLEPTSLGMGPIPPQYSPQQISAQRQRDLQSGFEGSPYADVMENYNELSRKQYNDYVSAASSHSTISNLRREAQEKFRNHLQEQTGISDPADLAVAESISELPEFKNIKNDKLRAQKTADAFNRYQAGKAAFEEGSERPYYFDPAYKRSIETLSPKLEPFKKYGQMDKARAILAKNGWSESEIEKIINPLSENIKKGMSNLPKVNKILSEHLSAEQDDGELAKEYNKMIGKWEDYLSKNIKKGTTNPLNQQVVEPGTSLVLMRNEADRMGVSPQAFDLMIKKLIDQGKIELDDEQYRQYNLMTKGLGRVKSIGEYLFGD